LWDYNLSQGNADYLTGDAPTGWYYTQIAGTDYPWYPRLFQDANYTLRHWDRYWEMRRGVWATSTVLGEIDANATLLQDGYAGNIGNNAHPALRNPIARHFTKYPILGVYVWPNAPGVTQRIYYNSHGNSALTGLTIKTSLGRRFIDHRISARTAGTSPPVTN
jgi:hypothetical protein